MEAAKELELMQAVADVQSPRKQEKVQGRGKWISLADLYNYSNLATSLPGRHFSISLKRHLIVTVEGRENWGTGWFLIAFLDRT